jgi:uncharacterized membrane protein YhaH (DUF805 family)
MIERKATEWMLLPLKRYAEFSGRSPRAEYWWFFLFSILITIPASIIDAVIGVQIVGGLVSLGLILPSLAVAVRRLHDLDRTGWWILAPLLVIGPAIAGAGLFGGLGAIGGLLGSEGAAGAGLGGAVLALGIGGVLGIGLSILLLVWYCTRGTQGPNKYGPDPLGPAENPTLYY